MNYDKMYLVNFFNKVLGAIRRQNSFFGKFIVCPFK